MSTISRWTICVITGVVLVGLPFIAEAETARWRIDPDHSLIEFRVSHMMVSKTTGRFVDYHGVVTMDAAAKTFATMEATINAASVDTKHEKRDAHLRNTDFLDVSRYPTMTYSMKRYTKQGEQYTFIGDLTLRGVTKEVTLIGSFNGFAQDPWGNTRAGFSVDGTLNRKDFGMTWNKTLDNGGLVVGNDVQIRLEIECVKEKQPQP
ncbi:MAG: YceI family protein [Nitrospira sp.]|nr:YceI family protein [Nitrospira sp.]